MAKITMATTADMKITDGAYVEVEVEVEAEPPEGAEDLVVILANSVAAIEAVDPTAESGPEPDGSAAPMS